MEQLLHLTSFDWLSVLSLFMLGLFLLLTPMLGYGGSNQAWLHGALWALVIKIGIVFLKTTLIHYELYMKYNVAGPSWVRVQLRAPSVRPSFTCSLSAHRLSRAYSLRPCLSSCSGSRP